jgi:hypothetical protein
MWYVISLQQLQIKALGYSDEQANASYENIVIYREIAVDRLPTELLETERTGLEDDIWP